MIVVRVEMHSAVTGQVTELARLHLCNISGGGARRSYEVRALRGRSTADPDRGHIQRVGRVQDFPSQAEHVWNLVAEALRATGYGRRQARAEGAA